MKTEFDNDWKNWIKTNLDNGQDKDGIFKILLDEGYSYDAICREMAYKPRLALSKLVNPFDAAKKNKIQQSSNYGTAIDQSKIFIPNANKLDSDRLELYTLESFLNNTECLKIIELIKSELSPSSLSSFESDKAYRTSRTCSLGTIGGDFMREIDLRICRLIGVEPSYSEPIQGQHYDVGQEFKPHTDYFEQHEMAKHGGLMGQRTFTVMIYLNNVEEGGETRFSEVNTQLAPSEGMAVIWSSLNSDGTTNSNSMHHALPILKGYKAVITKWFRSNSCLPNKPPMFNKEANEYIPNYTQAGFKTARLPQEVLEKIQRFYRANIKTEKEESVPGDFIFNARKKKTISSSLVDLNPALRKEIHDTLKPLLEDWTNKSLNPTYVYGIRNYHRGAMLKTHRDRLETHIISAIINVEQKVDKDWPLVIDDNYYRRHHVILKPGDMIFYEGARLTHGRPFEFIGDSFANIFCHFSPIDYIPRRCLDITLCE
jgi:prolyl 4-hydroxylase